jgi:DNA gyrase subunit B
MAATTACASSAAQQQPLQTIAASSERGTAIHFKPDLEVFGENTIFDFKIIAARLRELAFLNSGVRIGMQDLREEGKAEMFYSTDGLAAFVRYLNQGKDALHQVIHFRKTTPEGHEVELAMQFNDGYDEQIICFANNIRNRDGGTHLEGFKTALTREFNAYAKNANLIKGEKPPSGEDLREGVCAIVSVKLMDPKFSGQTKDKLINIEISGIVQNLLGAALKDYCEENPKIAKSLILKACAAMEAREAARKARELARKNRKSMLNNAGMPDKLRDCQSKNVHETEIFLVEGDSAGGSAKRGSNAHFQAILPLKGKIINVEKARIDKVIGHSEISAMIQALGTGIGEEFNLEGLRYGKIVIMTDADVDGSHIRTLLLTFFFRQMHKLIENGNIFVAQPPLYKVTRGKSSEYVYNEKLLNAEVLRLGLEGATLIDVSSGREREIRGPNLTAVLEVLQEFDEHEHVLSLKGLTIEEFLKLRDGSGRLPLFRARVGEAVRYLYSEAELDVLLGRDAGGARARPRSRRRRAEAVGGEVPILPEIIEFSEGEALERSLDRLRIHGFNPEFIVDGPGRLSPFRVVDAKEDVACTHLRAVVPIIKRFGQRGLDIQRYKGLGEMNPDQLWETTMDPEPPRPPARHPERRHRGRAHVRHPDGQRCEHPPRLHRALRAVGGQAHRRLAGPAGSADPAAAQAQGIAQVVGDARLAAARPLLRLMEAHPRTQLRPIRIWEDGRAHRLGAVARPDQAGETLARQRTQVPGAVAQGDLLHQQCRPSAQHHGVGRGVERDRRTAAHARRCPGPCAGRR